MDEENHLVEEKDDGNESITFKSLVSFFINY
jgi:hypothetical protein